MGEELNEECDLSQHSVSLFEDSVSFMETSLLQPVAEEAAATVETAVCVPGPDSSPSAKSSPGAVLDASTSQDPADDLPGAMNLGDDLGPSPMDDDQDLFVEPDPPATPVSEETRPTNAEAATTEATGEEVEQQEEVGLEFCPDLIQNSNLRA